jgi:tetratricopeptide (TPR) repeat protein
MAEAEIVGSRRAAQYNVRRGPLAAQEDEPMPDASPNALDNYQAAANANPTSAEAQCNLGWGFYGQRRYDEAIKALQHAVSLDSRSIDAHYGLGLAQKEAGAKQEAVETFQTVIKLAGELENAVRGQMLARLAQGHINLIQVGNWQLGGIVKPPDA